MLKYVESAVTFAEFPDEIALSLSISNCICQCKGCSESYLQQDIGTELTEEVLVELIKAKPGITLVGFLGGDCDHAQIGNLADFIHQTFPKLLVGFYSGLDYLDLELAGKLDYYKIGAFRPFTGPESTWKDQTAGPICLPTSNQIMFKRINGKLVNITDKFRTKPIKQWANTIIKAEED